MNEKVIFPGATLGVMGGGQLGRMFVQAAQSMGYFTAVLDPDPTSPAGLVAHYHIATDYLDEQGLAQLMQRCAAITTEFENVPAGALVTLGAYRRVAPAADGVAVCQDRSAEKAWFRRCGVACAPHALAEAWQQLGQLPCVLEKLLPLALELSVVVARSATGQTVQLPVQQNLHRDGILAVTQVPSPDATIAQQSQASQAASALAEAMDYVGVLCVEFFVLADGSLVANEMAPRPHNSAHWSIDGSDISQFELQVRTLTGLPLTAPRQHSAAVMLNLLGDLWFVDSATEKTPPWDRVLALPGVHLHLYGKASARPGRKMGHLTVTGIDADSARAGALQAAEILGLPTWSAA